MVKVSVPPTGTGLVEYKQMGVSADALLGPPVSWQENVTCPEYPLPAPTVMVAVELPPGLGIAAGGAVIFPTADVLALVPICPHTMSNRPLILPLASTICIKAISPAPATILSADGLLVGELDAGDAVTVRRSRRAVRLMHLADNSFLEALRRKLHWRGAYL